MLHPALGGEFGVAQRCGWELRPDGFEKGAMFRHIRAKEGQFGGGSRAIGMFRPQNEEELEDEQVGQDGDSDGGEEPGRVTNCVFPRESGSGRVHPSGKGAWLAGACFRGKGEGHGKSPAEGEIADLGNLLVGRSGIGGKDDAASGELPVLKSGVELFEGDFFFLEIKGRCGRGGDGEEEGVDRGGEGEGGRGQAQG